MSSQSSHLEATIELLRSRLELKEEEIGNLKEKLDRAHPQIIEFTQKETAKHFNQDLQKKFENASVELVYKNQEIMSLQERVSELSTRVDSLTSSLPIGVIPPLPLTYAPEKRNISIQVNTTMEETKGTSKNILNSSASLGAIQAIEDTEAVDLIMLLLYSTHWFPSFGNLRRLIIDHLQSKKPFLQSFYSLLSECTTYILSYQEPHIVLLSRLAVFLYILKLLQGLSYFDYFQGSDAAVLQCASSLLHIIDVSSLPLTDPIPFDEAKNPHPLHEGKETKAELLATYDTLLTCIALCTSLIERVLSASNQLESPEIENIIIKVIQSDNFLAILALPTDSSLPSSATSITSQESIPYPNYSSTSLSSYQTLQKDLQTLPSYYFPVNYTLSRLRISALKLLLSVLQIDNLSRLAIDRNIIPVQLISSLLCSELPFSLGFSQSWLMGNSSLVCLLKCCPSLPSMTTDPSLLSPSLASSSHYFDSSSPRVDALQLLHKTQIVAYSYQKLVLQILLLFIKRTPRHTYLLLRTIPPWQGYPYTSVLLNFPSKNNMAILQRILIAWYLATNDNRQLVRGETVDVDSTVIPTRHCLELVNALGRCAGQILLRLAMVSHSVSAGSESVKSAYGVNGGFGSLQPLLEVLSEDDLHIAKSSLTSLSMSSCGLFFQIVESVRSVSQATSRQGERRSDEKKRESFKEDDLQGRHGVLRLFPEDDTIFMDFQSMILPLETIVAELFVTRS